MNIQKIVYEVKKNEESTKWEINWEKKMFIFLWFIGIFPVFMLSDKGLPHTKKKVSVNYPELK